jgi:hypothetical protein
MKNSTIHIPATGGIMKLLNSINWAVFICIILFAVSCEKGENPDVDIGPTVPGIFCVRIRNYSWTMWIGTNSDSIGVIMEHHTGTQEKYWIGGGVVPDDSCPHGFYFDPNTILISEATVEGMQTTIQQIEEDPLYFSENGWSNGLAEHAWYISGIFLEYCSCE